MQDATTYLLLVRHARTAETGHLLTGRRPGVSLSDEGSCEAKELAERIGNLPISVLYSSPMERTMQTAEPIAAVRGLVIRELAGVLEADFGDWTGRTLKDLACEPQWETVQNSPAEAVFPGGESIVDMQERVVAALGEVISAHKGEVIAVVSHADPIKVAIASYLGLSLDQFQRFIISPASVSVLAFSEGAKDEGTSQTRRSPDQCSPTLLTLNNTCSALDGLGILKVIEETSSSDHSNPARGPESPSPRGPEALSHGVGDA